MARRDGQDPETSDESGEHADDALAVAETRVLTDEEGAELETRLVLDEDELDREAVANPGAASVAADADAATVLADPGAGLEAESAAVAQAEGDRAPDSDEDDRTQLITRGPGATQDSRVETAGSGEAAVSALNAGAAEGARAGDANARETRVLDPAAGPSSAAPAAAAASGRLPDTRVLEDRVKTSPPAVDEGAAVAGAAAAAAARKPAAPTPIDPERGLAPGTVLFGEYEIVNVLGVGGMGEVYRAKHRRLGEHRAIKVMHAELSKKKGASEFFYREAKALLAVRHPAVAHCHDMLSDDAGRVYLIMEMIEGIPLSKKMNDGPLSPDEVALLGARVSHGLAAAHRKGVIHRDVSPDNIVLPNGRVQEAKIIDFGIAKLLEEGEGTIVDGFKGKLSYASPEQLGFFGGKIDGRSDFYSLGLVLVAAAQGRPMQMGTTVVEAVDARRSFETLPDSIPVGLRSAIQPLLALDPDDRPRYVDRLFVVPGRDGAGDTGPISTGSIERSGGAKVEPANRTGMVAGGVAAAALLIGGGVYLGLGGFDAAGTAGVEAPTAAVVGGLVPAAGSTAGDTESNSAGNPTDAANQGKEASAAAPALAVVPEPVEPKPRRLSAGDRIKIIGLINNAKLALEENRLMSPANDNAYDRYMRVLELNPNETRAKTGLRSIATRYVTMADRAIDQGDTDQAKTYLERARRADAEYAGIAALERRLRD